jgi:hypothetical protein
MKGWVGCRLSFLIESDDLLCGAGQGEYQQPSTTALPLQLTCGNVTWDDALAAHTLQLRFRPRQMAEWAGAQPFRRLLAPVGLADHQLNLLLVFFWHFIPAATRTHIKLMSRAHRKIA